MRYIPSRLCTSITMLTVFRWYTHIRGHVYFHICNTCKIRPKSRQAWWNCSFLGWTTELNLLLCFHSLGFDMREPRFVRMRNKMSPSSNFVFLGFLIPYPHPSWHRTAPAIQALFPAGVFCVVITQLLLSFRSEIQVDVKKVRKRMMGLHGWTLFYPSFSQGIISSL